MPYRSTAELPPAVKNNLPAAAQRAWMKAFNRAYEQYHSDQAAARVAWSVVRRLYRKVGDKWVKK